MQSNNHFMQTASLVHAFNVPAQSRFLAGGKKRALRPVA